MITVIIPVYNVERFLDRCIDSVIGQSYRDLEIILVDDGSTDRSGIMCDKWAKKDKRIKVIHQTNAGLSGARNSGIDIAAGRYISFIDSDDYILPEYFEYLLKLITDYNADMSVCQLVDVDEKDNVIQTHSIEGEYLLEDTEKCMNDFFNAKAIDTTAWRKLYKSELFLETNIRYPIGFYHEDVFTTYKIIDHCNKIIVGNRALYAYRKRSGSIVNSSFSRKHLDGVYGKIEIFNYIIEKYPQLSERAACGIIYSANQCVIKIINSNNTTLEFQEYLQGIYREYGKYYLKSNNKLVKKIFAIAACINLKWLISTVKLIKRK